MEPRVSGLEERGGKRSRLEAKLVVHILTHIKVGNVFWTLLHERLVASSYQYAPVRTEFDQPSDPDPLAAIADAMIAARTYLSSKGHPISIEQLTFMDRIGGELYFSSTTVKDSCPKPGRHVVWVKTEQWISAILSRDVKIENYDKPHVLNSIVRNHLRNSFATLWADAERAGTSRFQFDRDELHGEEQSRRWLVAIARLAGESSFNPRGDPETVQLMETLLLVGNHPVKATVDSGASLCAVNRATAALVAGPPSSWSKLEFPRSAAGAVGDQTTNLLHYIEVWTSMGDAKLGPVHREKRKFYVMNSNIPCILGKNWFHDHQDLGLSFDWKQNILSFFSPGEIRRTIALPIAVAAANAGVKNACLNLIGSHCSPTSTMILPKGTVAAIRATMPSWSVAFSHTNCTEGKIMDHSTRIANPSVVPYGASILLCPNPAYAAESIAALVFRQLDARAMKKPDVTATLLLPDFTWAPFLSHLVRDFMVAAISQPIEVEDSVNNYKWNTRAYHLKPEPPVVTAKLIASLTSNMSAEALALARRVGPRFGHIPVKTSLMLLAYDDAGELRVLLNNTEDGTCSFVEGTCAEDSKSKVAAVRRTLFIDVNIQAPRSMQFRDIAYSDPVRKISPFAYFHLAARFHDTRTSELTPAGFFFWERASVLRTWFSTPEERVKKLSPPSHHPAYAQHLDEILALGPLVPVSGIGVEETPPTPSTSHSVPEDGGSSPEHSLPDVPPDIEEPRMEAETMEAPLADVAAPQLVVRMPESVQRAAELRAEELAREPDELSDLPDDF